MSEPGRVPLSKPAPDPDAGLRLLGSPLPPRMRLVFRAAALFSVAYVFLSLASSQTVPIESAVIATAGVLIFAIVMWRGMRERNRLRERDSVWTVAGVIAVALIALIYGVATGVREGSVGLVIFAVVAGGFLQPQRRALVAICAIPVAWWIVESLATRDPLAITPLAIEVAVVGFLMYSLSALRRTNLELVRARHDLARLAVAEERVRIGRDLHDTLGHSLTLIAMKMELVERLIDRDPERARAEAADARAAARDALASVRETVGGYRRPELAVEVDGVRRALTAVGIETRVDLAQLELPPAIDTVLAWTVREAATNILRHSGAQHAAISIGRRGPAAFAEITDDGRGGPVLGTEGAARQGSGLAGLAERVRAQGGSLEAGPGASGGFRLSVRIPLEPAA